MTIFRNWSDILRTSSGSILVTNRRGRHLYKRLNDYIIIRDLDKFSFNKSLTDIITLNDLITNRATFIRVINDNIILNENVTANQFISKLLSDMIDFNDSTLVNAQFNISLTDTLILNDSNLNTLSLNRVVLDTIVFSDLFLNGAFLNKTLNDIVVFNDDFNKISNIIRLLNENIVFNDSISNTLVFNKFIADNITFDDFLTDGAILNKLLNDNVVFSELFSEVLNINRLINDNIIFNDSFLKAVDFNRTIANQLLLNDNFSNVIGINKLLSDVLSFNDNFASVNTMNKTIVDVISLSDSRSTIALFNRTLADTLNLNDVVTKQAAFNRTLDNNVIFTDSTSRVLASSNFIYISPTGNDISGSGTIANPYRTLYKASTIATTGKTIYVKAGTYVETQRCNLAVGVNIIGEGDSSNIVCGYFSLDSYGVITCNSAPTQGTNGNQSISYIKLDGNNVGYAGIVVLYRSNVKIHHCTISNFLSIGVNFNGGYVPSSGYTSPGSPPTTYETGNELYNCNINDCSTYTYYNGSLKVGGQSGLLVYDNIFHNDGRVDGQNGDIIMGWGTHFKGLKVYNNKFYKPLTQTTAWNFTFEVGNTYGGNEIYNNEFYNGTMDIAAWSNVKGAYTYSWWIHDNLFKLDRRITESEDYHGTYATTFEATIEDAIFNNNHVINYPNGVSIDLLQTPRNVNNVKIYNNLFESMGHSNNSWSFIFQIANGIAGNTIQNVYYDNNTMIGSSAGIHFVNVASSIMQNIYFRNNIIKDIIQYGWMYVQTNQGTLQNIYLQNNDVYNCINGTAIKYEAGQIPISNLIISSQITTNPLLDGTYHLNVGSPCIDAGIDVGLPYNGTAPDLGAFETT